MSVISNLPAMPNRIAFACEYFYYLGEKGGERSSVESQLSPLKKVDAQDQEGKSGKSMADDVLGEMEKLKILVQSSGNVIKLNPDIKDVDLPDGDWQQALRPILFSRLTVPENAEACGQIEVPDALSWLLTQDPFDPMPWSGGEHVERIVLQLGENDPMRNLIGNNSRFQNLIYWARYLGFAERVSVKIGLNAVDMVIPDPTEAIFTHLSEVFVSDPELPIQAFMQRLADVCPVLDGGSSRHNLEARLKDEYQPKENHISRATSLALMRLATRGDLKLENPSDAKSWILDLGQTTQAVSYVRFLQGGGA